MTPEERSILIWHILFFAILLLLLLLPLHIAKGYVFLSMVILYDIIILYVGFKYRGSNILDIWIFSALLSVFQVLPDWYLSAGLNVLVFPEDGVFKIGTVSGYMMGLWTIPIFIVIYLSLKILAWRGNKQAYMTAAIASAIIFISSELVSHLAGSWYAQNVLMFGDLALYIIIPEILLGLASFHAYQQVQNTQFINKLIATCAVMIFYMGCAVGSYFMLEVLVLN